MNNPDESICLDHDVEVDGSCDRDVVRSADARVVQHVVVDIDDGDGRSCLEIDVQHVDVGQMGDPDESINFDYGVKIDG